MANHYRCQHWEPEPTRCTRDAEVTMYAPDGDMVPGGFYCRAHAEACVNEYAAKLGEVWTLRPIA